MTAWSYKKGRTLEGMIWGKGTLKSKQEIASRSKIIIDVIRCRACGKPTVGRRTNFKVGHQTAHAYRITRRSKTACDVTISPRKLASKLLCIRGSRRESKRKQRLILLFKRDSFLKNTSSFSFSPLLLSFWSLESEEIVTSSSVLDHREDTQVVQPFLPPPPRSFQKRWRNIDR